MALIANLPAKWDLETDLIAVGSGGGGLAAAITATTIYGTTPVTGVTIKCCTAK